MICVCACVVGLVHMSLEWHFEVVEFTCASIGCGSSPSRQRSNTITYILASLHEVESFTGDVRMSWKTNCKGILDLKFSWELHGICMWVDILFYWISAWISLFRYPRCTRYELKMPRRVSNDVEGMGDDAGGVLRWSSSLWRKCHCAQGALSVDLSVDLSALADIHNYTAWSLQLSWQVLHMCCG